MEQDSPESTRAVMRRGYHLTRSSAVLGCARSPVGKLFDGFLWCGHYVQIGQIFFRPVEFCLILDAARLASGSGSAWNHQEHGQQEYYAQEHYE